MLINREQIAANLASIRARIEAACLRSGRNADEVRLLPVSKTHPASVLREAYAADCMEFAENRVQEAEQKAIELSDLADLRWCIIGHLQTNKARQVARFAHEFQALDSLKLAQELDRRLQAEGRSLDVLVQVNSSGEPQKSGLDVADVPSFVQRLPQFNSLRVKGLMTLAEHSTEPERVRACFVRMRELQQRLRDGAPAGISFDELSMGMSGDFELAIEEGSTTVRIGQAIFGARH